MLNNWPLVPLAPETIAILAALQRDRDETLNDVIAREVTRLGKASPVPLREPDPCSPSSGPVRFELLGVQRSAADANQTLIIILRELQQRDAGFLSRLAPMVVGRTRNHLARSRSLVYPHRPDLAEQFVVDLVPGWFVGTNISNRKKQSLLEHACRAAGLVFGSDLRIDLVSSSRTCAG